MNWKFWQRKKLPSPGPDTQEIDATSVVPKLYHLQFVSERPSKDHFGNPTTIVKLRCNVTGETHEEVDYGRNRYNVTMERSCPCCGVRIFGEDIQQDQWGNSRDEVRKRLGLRDSENGLTREQRSVLEQGKCPDCGGDQWFTGPSGGASTNYYCAGELCGSRFNICLPILAERISEPSPNKPKAVTS